MAIPTPQNTHIIVTDHALDMYRERVTPHASERDVAKALRAAQLIPKNTTDFQAQLLIAHTEPGCTYYYERDRAVLFVTRQNRDGIRVVTVLVGEDRTPRPSVAHDDISGAQRDAIPRHGDGRPMHPVTALKSLAHQLEIQIQEHSPGSERRRAIGRELQEVQKKLASLKMVSSLETLPTPGKS